MNFDVKRIETKLLAVFLAIVLAAASVPLAALASDTLVIEANAGTEEVLEPQGADEGSEPSQEEAPSPEQTPESADLEQEPALEQQDEQLSEEEPKESVDQQLIAEEDGDGAVSVGVVAITPGGASDEAEQEEALPEEHVASPLYVELYGDGFEAGEQIELVLQREEQGVFVDAKLLSVGFGERSGAIENLEESTYRLVLADEAIAAELSLSVVVDGVEESADFERGFKFDPSKETLAKLKVEAPVAEDTVEAEPAAEETDAAEEDLECSLTFNLTGSASVRLVHKDGTEVSLSSGMGHTFTGSENQNVQIYGTSQNPVNVSIEVLDASVGKATGGSDYYASVTEFFREVSFAGTDRIVNIDASEASASSYVRGTVARMMSPLTRSGSTSQPEVGDVFSGRSTVTYVQVLTANGMTGDIAVSFTSGILAGESNVIVHCDDHGRAAPVASRNNVWNYTYTITSVNKSTGNVVGSLLLEGTGEYIYADGYQRLAGSHSIKRSYQGYIDLQKASTCPDLVTSSDLYSLGGAEYGIYFDSACTRLVATLVTDESGYAKSGVLDAGTYYVKETKAPEGHYLDENVYTTVVSGGTARVNGSKVVDEAINDPAAMWAFKKDAETGEASPQGGASLAGAQFTVRYFDGFYDSVEAAEASGDPARTWIVETNANGVAVATDSFQVGGDSFYYVDGHVVVPVGTLLIQETQAPNGYLVDTRVFLRQVTTNGVSDVVAYNAPEVPEQVVRGGISISKTLEGGANEELEGIAFFIFNSQGEKMTFEGSDGEMTDRLILNAEGKAETAKDALVYDTYTVVEDESSVPDDIIWYGDAQGGGSAVVDEVSVSEPLVVYNVDVVNYKKPAFDLIKVDGDSLRDEGSGEKALKVSGSEWKLEYNDGGNWVEVGSYVTDENGRISFGEQAISQWGTYRLTEVMPAEVGSEDGYMWPVDSNDAEFVEFVIDENTWAKFEAGTYEGEAGDSWSYQMVDGKPALVHCASNWRYRDIEVVKIDEETGDPVANTSFSLWRYVGEGEPVELGDTRSEKHGLYSEDPSAEIDATLWEKVSEGTTDVNGSCIFRGLTFGYYMTVEELPAPGYAYWWESEKSSWATYFFEVGEREQKQVQVYENLKITLETTVDKSTIERTSAAFVSLPDQNVSYDNVNIEEYRYDVGFTNGSTNVRADQYSVIDECEFTALGLRLSTLTTPVVANDTDGSYNIWYRTNMTDSSAVYSEASATTSNPENEMADGTDRVTTAGWKLWAGGLSVSSRQSLSVSDLGLAEGEYVTRLMLEFGSVEVGFETTSPLSYMVYSTRELSGDTVIPNTATSHITRNWNGGPEGSGLYDDASDKVETRVIDTLKFEPGKSTWTPTGWVIGQTGDEVGWIVAGIAASLILSAGAILLARRREKSK